MLLPSFFRRSHEIDDDSDGGFDTSGAFLPGGSSSVFVLVFGSQRQFDVVGRHLLAQRQRLPPQGAIHVVQCRSQTGARRPVRPVLLRGQLLKFGFIRNVISHHIDALTGSAGSWVKTNRFGNFSVLFPLLGFAVRLLECRLSVCVLCPSYSVTLFLSGTL